MSAEGVPVAWIEVDGQRVWSVGWQARRGTSFTPGMVDTLRRQAVEHLDEIQRHNEDPKRVGPERCPAMAWVIVDRLLAHPAAASAERDALVAKCVEALDRVVLFIENAVVTDGADNVRDIAGARSVVSMIARALTAARGAKTGGE